MKKWMIVLSVSAVVLGGGGYAAYQYGMNLAADKISDELEKNPDIIKQVEAEIEKNKEDLARLEAEQQEKKEPKEEEGASAPAAPAGTGSGQAEPTADSEETQPPAAKPSSEKPASSKQPASSGGKEFSSRNEAVRFAMSRFSASEINQVRQMAADGLTAAEKAKLKSIAYSKFSAEEIAAVQQAVSN
jgi:Arc/MetJ-type ribon-helix-helix transcriptional regulator